jgi:hypothetical protein
MPGESKHGDVSHNQLPSPAHPETRIVNVSKHATGYPCVQYQAVR